jgi:hypothetical protein
MTSALTFVARALFVPDRAFLARESSRVSKLALTAILFLTYVAGERLATGFYQSSFAKTLSVLEVDARLSGLMSNAPPDVQDRVRQQALDSILGEGSALLTALSIVLSGFGFLLVLWEMWLVCSVVSQFFGGQEERSISASLSEGRIPKDRPALSLFLIAFFPLALRKLAEGAVLAFRNPEAYANALTLAEYKAASAVRFDLFTLFHPNGVPEIFAAAARMLSDPFHLWWLAVIVLGGARVYRIPWRSALALGLILVTILSLQNVLLGRIGIAWEV